MGQEQRLIDELARKHHSPKRVEQFGAEPVPASLRNTRWYDLFLIVAAFWINPIQLAVTGASITVLGLSFWEAVLSQVLGVSLAYVANLLVGTYGVDYGLPGQVGARFAFGILGSRFVASPLRIIASTYFFAGQTIAGGFALQSLIKALTGATYNVILISVLFALFETIIALIGFESLKLTTRIVLPLKVILMSIMLGYFFTATPVAFHFSHVVAVPAKSSGWVPFALSTSITMGIFLTTVTDAADFCRYTAKRRDIWLGFLPGTILSFAFISFIGAYSTVATGNWNAFAAMASLKPGAVLLSLLVVTVILDNWSINILNLYTAGLSLVNTIPKMGRFWATVAASVFGVLASGLPALVTHIEPFVMALGNLFSPMAAVLLADYLFIRKLKIDLPALYDRRKQYWYVAGFNPIAILTVIMLYFGFRLVPKELIPSLAATIGGMLLYIALMKIATALWPLMREAIKTPDNITYDVALVDEELVTRL